MADSVSDKEVQNSRKRVDDLRQKILAEQVKSSVAVSDGANALKKAALDSEAERLEAQLAAMRDAGKDATKVIKAQVNEAASSGPVDPVLINPTVAQPDAGKEGEK